MHLNLPVIGAIILSIRPTRDLNNCTIIKRQTASSGLSVLHLFAHLNTFVINAATRFSDFYFTPANTHSTMMIVAHTRTALLSLFHAFQIHFAVEILFYYLYCCRATAFMFMDMRMLVLDIHVMLINVDCNFIFRYYFSSLIKSANFKIN